MTITIARPSLCSILLEPRSNGEPLGTGTGFVVEIAGKPYLVTNWHVLAGRNPQTGENMHPTGAWPDRLRILHNDTKGIGNWVYREEEVRDEAGPLWLEHPVHGRKVDVVLLPLTALEGVKLYPHDPQAGGDYAIGVASGVSIIGFPFGLTGGGACGIWVQGAIATEPALDYDDLPCFLIDSRTRPGQSGSPVLFYTNGGMVQMAGGGSQITGGEISKLLGVYSGRINEQSDLGFVWKAQVLDEIAVGQARGAD